MTFTTLNEAYNAVKDAAASIWSSFEDVTHREEFVDDDTRVVRIGACRVRLGLDCGTPAYKVFFNHIDFERGHIETYDDALALVELCMKDE